MVVKEDIILNLELEKIKVESEIKKLEIYLKEIEMEIEKYNERKKKI